MYKSYGKEKNRNDYYYAFGVIMLGVTIFNIDMVTTIVDSGTVVNFKKVIIFDYFQSVMLAKTHYKKGMRIKNKKLF